MPKQAWNVYVDVFFDAKSLEEVENNPPFFFETDIEAEDMEEAKEKVLVWAR